MVPVKYILTISLKSRFQQMLKSDHLMKSIENQATQALRLLLGQVPALKLLEFEQEEPGPDEDVDIVAHIDLSGRHHALVCDVKSSGQPRHVRMALLQLRNYIVHHAQDATPVIIAYEWRGIGSQRGGVKGCQSVA